MAAVKYVTQGQIQARSVTLEKKLVAFEAVVSKDDTITVVELAELTAHYVVSALDGSAVDHTVDDNVITITEDPCDGLKVFVVLVG